MSVAVYFSHGITIFYITLIFYLKLCDSTVIAFRQHQNEIARNFSEAIVEVVQRYFIDRKVRTGFNFQVKAENLKNLQFFQEIVDGTVKLLGDNISVTLSNVIPIANSKEMHYSILLVDSMESLEFLYLNIIQYDLYIHGSFFIVLHSLCCPSHYYNDLSGILKQSWLAGISHASILVYAVNNVILLFHGVPFTVFHCDVNAPVIFNKFADGQWQHKNFYLSKTSNMFGCPLICATWEDMPYFMIGTSSTKDKPIYMGIEGRLLEYLAHRMNFTVTVRWMTEVDINRTIYDEHSLLNKIFNTGTDFAFGAFHHKSTTLEDVFIPTRTYFLSTYYFIVSSGTDPYEPFEKLLLPFAMESWTVLIIFYITGNVTIYLVSYLARQWKLLILGRRNQSPFYNMISISLGQTVNRDPKVSFSRFLLMVWILATLVLRVVYQGLMYHFVKHDLHKHPPKTIDQLSVGYELFMTEIVYNSVQHISWLYNNVNILNTTEFEGFDMLRNSANSALEKVAILTPHEYFGYYKKFNLASDYLYLVPEILFTQQLSIYMQKNSVFLKRFNIYIESYINEGISNRWEGLLIYSDRNYRCHDNEPAKAMKLTQLYGAIKLLFIGLCIGVCIFVGELGVFGLKVFGRRATKIWGKRAKKRNQRRIQIEFSK